MYQFVLLYRIGQKQILQEQILLCAMVIHALEGPQDKLLDELRHINAASNSMKDYFKLDLGL